jgi:hypothetical protein
VNRVDVDGMLSEITAEQLAELVAYSDLEPWGDERADLRAAIVASAVANVPANFWGKAGRARPKDFMPDFGRTEQVAQSGSQMALEAMAWVAGMAPPKSVQPDLDAPHGDEPGDQEHAIPDGVDGAGVFELPENDERPEGE